MEKLSKKVKEIEMPEDMRKRILRNCYHEMEESSMKKKGIHKIFGRPMAAVVTLALCICLTGVTTLATSGRLQGFFKDITRWDGAVVGTSYEQATDELAVSAAVEGDNLIVVAEVVAAKAAPYIYIETFGIKKYEIADGDGKIIMKGEETAPAELVDGRAELSIPIQDLSAGNYKLLVYEFVGCKKADQPLVISGTWNCDFSI